MQPHRKRYWLTPPSDDPTQLAEQICTVCEVYEATRALAEQGTHVLSTDEMTGIQALERLHPSLPMLPGHVERQEFEYKRHGTLSLIANLEVATGQLVTPSLGPTRTEADFVAHITRTIQTDPEAGWIFITDQLNTASIGDLGASGGGLVWHPGGSGQQRQKWPPCEHEHACSFSLRPSHRIRFVYTPKHSSWLNQIEMWFSILVRRVLARASWVSVTQLRQGILAFIAYYNRLSNGPFHWTYKGPARP